MGGKGQEASEKMSVGVATTRVPIIFCNLPVERSLEGPPFVHGKAMGGLYDGLVPSLDNGSFWKQLHKETSIPQEVSADVGAFE